MKGKLVVLFALFLAIVFSSPVLAEPTAQIVSSVTWGGGEIAVVFSKPMDSSTINNDTLGLIIEIPGVGYGTVAGEVRYEDTKGMFIPSSPLVSGLKYTLSVTTEAKDTEGNALLTVFRESHVPGTVKEGIFWDGPVRGLAYVSGNQSGFTDDEGRFTYEDGKTVTFMVGDIVVGEAAASPMMTPADLAPAGQDYTDAKVANIVRFLETLDADENPYNGIDIEADEKYDGESIDFTSRAFFETEAEALVDKVFGDERNLVSLQDAMDHFRLALLMVPESEIEQSVQQILDGAVVSNDLPGVSFSVLTLDGSKWNGTSGVSDMETGEPMRPDHRVRIGSVTKTFTAMTILQLAQEGKLELDDTVAEWLPDALSDQYDAENITIRQLLNHTNGVYSFPSDEQLIMNSLLDQSVTFTPQELVDIANNYDPAAPPGEEWHYTSTGPVLLGMIIELATGSTWEEEVRTRFTDVLGLEDTLVPETGQTNIPGRYAHGYFDLYGFSGGMAGQEGVLIDATEREPSVPWSSGNMISTPGNVARWFMAMGEGELLDPEYQTTLMTDKFEVAAAPIESGLGVIFNPNFGLMQHPGQIFGYDSGGFYRMETHTAFGLATNRTLPGPKIHQLVLYDVLDVLFGDVTEESDARSRSDRWYMEPSGGVSGTLSEY